MEVLLKLRVTPEGWPEADRPMAELKEPKAAVVMVDVPLAPGPQRRHWARQKC